MTTPPQDQPERVEPSDPSTPAEPGPVQQEELSPEQPAPEELQPAPQAGTTQDDVIRGDQQARGGS